MKNGPIDNEEIAAAETDYNRLRNLIRNDIVNDRLKAGSRLKIRELTARYSASAIPVREALQQLQGEGIVRFIANRGASVRAIDTDFIRDIYEIRELIEPFLARWFVRHHKDGDLERLEAIQRDFDAAIEASEWTKLRALNREFHGICYDSHYNEEALLMAYKHNDFINALADRFPRSRARSLAVAREHRAIIAAIRAQDENRTARAVEMHVRRSGMHLIERMKAAGRLASHEDDDGRPSLSARETRFR